MTVNPRGMTLDSLHLLKLPTSICTLGLLADGIAQANTASGSQMAAKKESDRAIMLEKQKKSEEKKKAEAAAGGVKKT